MRPSQPGGPRPLRALRRAPGRRRRVRPAAHQPRTGPRLGPALPHQRLPLAGVPAAHLPTTRCPTTRCPTTRRPTTRRPTTRRPGLGPAGLRPTGGALRDGAPRRTSRVRGRPRVRPGGPADGPAHAPRPAQHRDRRRHRHRHRDRARRGRRDRGPGLDRAVTSPVQLPVPATSPVQLHGPRPGNGAGDIAGAVARPQTEKRCRRHRRHEFLHRRSHGGGPLGRPRRAGEDRTFRANAQCAVARGRWVLYDPRGHGDAARWQALGKGGRSSGGVPTSQPCRPGAGVAARRGRPDTGPAGR